ncbi:hypothetical protein [Ferrimonas lipolytica]|uniref:Uncharacterized protein n=1 Tax=Ferrimonas lipolytica TaxID=2724191 RepID=A0A6H1UEX3_9GAMM|nr:hypothetical protein [Ferrimonas lipolytica]QIZ77631.1 hypothetical protein HER31_12450 [Ferrimonas lipolytica]
MTPSDQRYRQLRAANGGDFHTCFYCGCLATEFDFAPPQAHWQSFHYRQASADNLQVPACKECATFLKKCSMGLVQQRRELVHTKIAAKYAKSIGVYLRWNQDELAQMDYGFSHSLGAGMKLGEESHRRSNYQGFAYELDGAIVAASAPTPVPIHVFEQRFNSIKEALVAVSKRYGISQTKLVDGLAKHDNNLEAVVMAVQREQEQALYQRQLRSQCRAFAKQHNQSVRYVTNSVERYLDKNELMTVPEALEKLYQERVKHPNKL